MHRRLKGVSCINGRSCRIPAEILYLDGLEIEAGYSRVACIAAGPFEKAWRGGVLVKASARQGCRAELIAQWGALWRGCFEYSWSAPFRRAPSSRAPRRCLWSALSNRAAYFGWAPLGAHSGRRLLVERLPGRHPLAEQLSGRRSLARRLSGRHSLAERLSGRRSLAERLRGGMTWGFSPNTTLRLPSSSWLPAGAREVALVGSLRIPKIFNLLRILNYRRLRGAFNRRRLFFPEKPHYWDTFCEASSRRGLMMGPHDPMGRFGVRSVSPN